jgi:hypothetical protein
MKTKPFITASLFLSLPFCVALVADNGNTSARKTRAGKPLYTYTLAQDGTQASYDEAMAVASLQGIINRASPDLYVLSRTNTRPQFWLDLLAKDGRWLQGRARKPQPDLTALVKLAGKRLKGAVIWDPAVPASANVATTLAGVHDAVVLSPELAAGYLAQWRLPVLKVHRRGDWQQEERRVPVGAPGVSGARVVFLAPALPL